MTEILFLVGACLIVAAMLIYGALCRIADAVEAQNKHYGIGAQPENAAKPGEAA